MSSIKRVERRQAVELKKVKKKKDKALLKSFIEMGVGEEFATEMIEEHPTVINEELTYEEVVAGYDMASASMKYTIDIVEQIKLSTVNEDVDKASFDKLLDGIELNLNEVKSSHLSVLDKVDDFRYKHDTITDDDAMFMLDIVSHTQLTQQTLLQLQEPMFMNLAISTNLDISDMGGVE